MSTISFANSDENLENQKNTSVVLSATVDCEKQKVYWTDNGQVPKWVILDISRFSFGRTYIHGFLHGRSTIPN